MVGEHEPRLWKAVGLLVVGMGAVLLGGIIPHEWTGNVFIIFGILSSLYSIVEAAMCNISHFLGLRDHHILVQKEVIDALAKADPDVRNAIGAWFPRYNFIYAGQPIVCWQDTIVPLSDFREFMKESNAQYTVAERDWKARGATYHRYWNIIYTKLVEFELIVPDSSAGNHSQMWSGRGYDKAWEMWMTHSIPEL